MLLYLMLCAIIVAVEGFKCPNGKLTSDQRDQIVRQNNEHRKKLVYGKLRNRDGMYMPRGKNMLQMKWNCTLEQSAQRWADNCNFAHSPQENRRGIGENIYTYWSSESIKDHSSGGTDAGKAWWKELETHYPNNPSNRLQFGALSGALHFTQMAWGKTHKIGCGIATHCKNGQQLIVVCQYWPAGNVINELIYEPGEPCKTDKDCYTNKCMKNGGLCQI